MSDILAKKTYTPCRGGIPPLTRQEAEALLVQAPDWLLVDEAYRIERTFRFKNFREALTFVQKVGELAKAEAITPTRLRSRVLTKHQRCSSRTPRSNDALRSRKRGILARKAAMGRTGCFGWETAVRRATGLP
jgi:hypothetical protein